MREGCTKETKVTDPHLATAKRTTPCISKLAYSCYVREIAGFKLNLSPFPMPQNQ